ncbi:helix-turn-helix transcriptional regulator [Natronospira bacteriovora]|uniref:AlpA family phage regulatory protein n=1 Tax=Natronospira bacteriovora TaxID=3069753 RepID=A0ABU0W5C8_9GAMM|nr:AlpA family phage regulatory protein [Natronospira sp. AB-CW4]MDQ2069196.1 AlpA family phage regulatory protein [Natronospira sp. AB-CW4]
MERLEKEESPSRLCRKAEVIARTGLSDTSIWRREKEGRFPPRIRLGARCTVWRACDLEQWLADPAGYQREVADV